MALCEWFEPQGRLQVDSATQISYQPLVGFRVFVTGAAIVIPSAGVTMQTTGLTQATTYYLYAFSSGGTVALEGSTTAYTIDSTYGHPIKTTDATRVLLGLFRTDSTAASFHDTATQRFLINYFWRRRRSLLNGLTANTSMTTTAYQELSTTTGRVEFVMWADDIVQALFTGSMGASAAGASIFAAVGDSNTTALTGGIEFNSQGFNNPPGGNPFLVPFAARADITGEGYHYATMLGKVSTATATWGVSVGTNTERPQLSGFVLG